MPDRCIWKELALNVLLPNVRQQDKDAKDVLYSGCFHHFDFV
jgi:hypothetical protein